MFVSIKNWWKRMNKPATPSPMLIGYQPLPLHREPKLPPILQCTPPPPSNLPKVETDTPMPKVKEPKSTSPSAMHEFIHEQIGRYETVYLAAIENKFSPEEAKKHADNVINQTMCLYIYHCIDNGEENESVS